MNRSLSVCRAAALALLLALPRLALAAPREAPRPLSEAERHLMGQRARQAASACSEENFVDAWRAWSSLWPPWSW